METELLVSTIRDGASQSIHERQPSLFEVMLVEQIDSMIKPAIRHALISLVDSMSPQFFPLTIALRDRWGEICNLLTIVIQIMCVRAHGASLAEFIYGLTRRSVRGPDYMHLDKSTDKARVLSSAPMVKFQQELSIILIAILPTFMDSVKNFAEEFRRILERRRRHREAVRSRQLEVEMAQTEASHSLPPPTGGTSRRASLLRYLSTLRVFTDTANQMRSVVENVAESVIEHAVCAVPFLFATAGFSVVVQKWLYLRGSSVFTHPLHAAAGIVLAIKSPQRHSDYPERSLESPTTSPRHVVMSTTSKNTGLSRWRALAVLGAVAGLRCLQWVLRNRETHQRMALQSRMAATAIHGANVAQRVPPPPRRPTCRPAAERAPPGICPLCLEPHVAPAISTGGYVFCHDCLVNSLRAATKRGAIPSCPITDIYCAEGDIICIH